MMLFTVLLLLPLLVSGEELLRNTYKMRIDDAILKSIHQERAIEANELDLSSLGLRGLASDVFDNIPWIKSVDLANNSLSVLPDFVFSNLTKLEYLSLANNKIDSTKYMFVGLNNLKVLNISHTSIRYIEAGHLFGLTKNTDIVTRGNILYSINSHAFENAFIKHPTSMLLEEDLPVFEDTGVQERSEGVLDANLRIQMCLDGGTLTLLEQLTDSAKLNANCQMAKIDSEERSVVLRNLGIVGFHANWYRLQQLPVVKLDFGYNEIEEIGAELINDLPASVTTVILLNNKIRHVRSGVIENDSVRELVLSRNLIEDIEDKAFDKTKLDGLYVSENRLKNVQFVTSLPVSLKKLVIADNYHELEFSSNIFSGLSRLLYLNLSNNTITKLNKDTFVGLGNLDALALDYNNLTKLEAGCFRGLDKLETLTIKYNAISEIKSGAFSELYALKRLFMYGNKLTVITSETFEGLPKNVINLDLSGGVIETLEKGSFVHNRLTHLGLSDNKIAKIEPGAFDLPFLVNLQLDDNRLKKLDSKIFTGLPGLRQLFLMNNRIETVEPSFGKYLGNITNLHLIENPFRELRNGAFHGLFARREGHVHLANNKIELIQGGVFEEA